MPSRWHAAPCAFQGHCLAARATTLHFHGDIQSMNTRARPAHTLKDEAELGGDMGAVNYYPVIFRAVSRLPNNTPKSRLEVHSKARMALATHTDAKAEHKALEWAIRAVEKSPREIPGSRASTPSLILSIFFLKMLWISDPTSMSAYWVVRPWNKHLSPPK
jgi:hypothetical protein